MKFLFAFIAGIFGSLFRRWFGGWVEHEYFGKTIPEWLYKILHSRGTQTVFLVLLFFTCFMMNDYWILTPISSFIHNLGISKWIIALIMAILFQLQFYSGGHGSAFDLGRWDPEEYKERYKRAWFNKICEKLIPEKYWYGFLYDFIWMTLRYAYGASCIIPFIWSFNILWLGLITASIYAFCWTIFEKDKWLINKIPYHIASNATQTAELLVGFVVGFWLMYM